MFAFLPLLGSVGGGRGERESGPLGEKCTWDEAGCRNA